MNSAIILLEIINTSVSEVMALKNIPSQGNIFLDIKKIIQSYIDNESELVFSELTNSEISNLFQRIRTHIQSTDPSLTSQPTPFFQELLNSFHIYNKHLIQQVNSFDQLFQGSVAFYNNSSILRFVKETVVFPTESTILEGFNVTIISNPETYTADKLRETFLSLPDNYNTLDLIQSSTANIFPQLNLLKFLSDYILEDKLDAKESMYSTITHGGYSQFYRVAESASAALQLDNCMLTDKIIILSGDSLISHALTII